jgi:hypothetical protein
MLSSPRSLGFVLAAILGAMLVPGCRPAASLSQRETARLAWQGQALFSRLTGSAIGLGRSVILPGSPDSTAPAGQQRL